MAETVQAMRGKTQVRQVVREHKEELNQRGLRVIDVDVFLGSKLIDMYYFNDTAFRLARSARNGRETVDVYAPAGISETARLEEFYALIDEVNVR